MSLCVIHGSEAFPKRLGEGSGHQGSMPTNWNPLPKDLEHRAGAKMHVEGEAGSWGEKIPPVGGGGRASAPGPSWEVQTGSPQVPGFLGSKVQ